MPLAWMWEPGTVGIRDAALNVALYVPAGFLFFYLPRRPRGSASRIATATLLGTALSLIVELLQAFEAFRVSSSIDLLTNALGTAVGACLAWFLSRRTGVWTLIADRAAPFALIVIMLAGYLYPFFPIGNLPTLMNNVRHLGARPRLDAIVFSAMNWLAIRFALAALLNRASVSRELALMLLAIPAQLLILDQTASTADIVGGLLALAIQHFWLSRTTIKPEQFAPIMLIGLIARELQPYRFSGAPQSFQWVPFANFLEGTPAAVSLFLNKSFLYAAVLWMFNPEARIMLRIAIPVAVLMALLEWVQRYIPGRTPEITDSVMILIAGFALWLLQPRDRYRMRPAEYSR